MTPVRRYGSEAEPLRDPGGRYRWGTDKDVLDLNCWEANVWDANVWDPDAWQGDNI